MRYALGIIMGIAALSLAACAPSTPYKVTYIETGDTFTTPWTPAIATVIYAGADGSTTRIIDGPLPDRQSFTVRGCHKLRVWGQLAHGMFMEVQIEVNGKESALAVSNGPYTLAMAQAWTC